MSGIVTPFLIVVGAWIGAVSCSAPRGLSPAPVTAGHPIFDPLSMHASAARLYRRNTQEADETARFLAISALSTQLPQHQGTS